MVILKFKDSAINVCIQDYPSQGSLTSQCPGSAAWAAGSRAMSIANATPTPLFWIA
ncbi:hypothetical protein HYY74_05095 [Candidatus Woesearchaeota archaeon]|nr:hypothetical protein [Candidatus Woesearchaeota archaeon]